jgi:hypothetical protein
MIGYLDYTRNSFLSPYRLEINCYLKLTITKYTRLNNNLDYFVFNYRRNTKYFTKPICKLEGDKLTIYSRNKTFLKEYKKEYAKG